MDIWMDGQTIDRETQIDNDRHKDRYVIDLPTARYTSRQTDLLTDR